MKILKFASLLVPFVISGEKTSTWRLFDDKNLTTGDDLEFQNAENRETIGYGRIISHKEKKIKEIKEEDSIGHEKFKNAEEIITNFKKYYGDNVDEDSIVKIIHFSFKKV